jgi:dTDP-4-dehydrorhamnose reductase
MLRLGAQHHRLRVLDDQRGGPTPAADIAEALLTMAAALSNGHGATGILHYAGAPAVSWADFAEAIFAARGGQAPAIERIPSSAWPQPALRPINSVLNCTRIAAAYGIPQPDWRPRLGEIIGELA